VTYKILIVDDSMLARMAVVKALKALHPDWTRIEAASASEATRLVKESAPHIAVLDFNMPGGNGLDLAADLRASNPGMPVAVVSANHQQEILNRARTVGATFLPKPLTEKALGEFLTEALKDLKKASR
jgi:DNA-binding NarL/FixJ family response regulator